MKKSRKARHSPALIDEAEIIAAFAGELTQAEIRAALDELQKRGIVRATEIPEGAIFAPGSKLLN
jgi:hypothetical protein